MHSSHPPRLFLLAALATGAVAVTAGAEELYRYTPAPTGERDTVAAIAYSESTGKWGYKYDHSIADFSRRGAVKNANAKDAKVVVVGVNMWCALALGDDKTVYGVGTGGSAEIASRLALRAARRGTNNCHVAVCVHSRVGKGR
ncbi:MAG: DUF4189 domain-containing protein [Gemmataceae bacterium]